MSEISTTIIIEIICLIANLLLLFINIHNIKKIKNEYNNLDKYNLFLQGQAVSIEKLIKIIQETEGLKK